MRRLKTVLLICGAMLAVLLLAACGGGGADVPAMTELADWQAYTIMRPDNASQENVDAAIALRHAVKDKLGAEANLTTDWVKRGEDVPVGTKEILVGPTNRPESAAGGDLKYGDFAIAFEGGRVVINGGSGEAILAGVNWFIDNCIDKTMMVPESTYVLRGEYPLENVTIAGVKLSDFTVTTAAGDPNAAAFDELRGWILKGTGVQPADDGKHTIQVFVDPTQPMEDISIRSDKSGITLTVSDIGASASQALEALRAAVEARTNDSMELNEVKKVEFKNYKTASAEYIAEIEAKADARREEILSTPNMKIPAGSRVYYISPNGDDKKDGTSPENAWKTIEKLNGTAIPAGSYVCFERGGIWRGKFSAREGVTYTAYGEGDKPEIWGSPFNGAETGKWEEVAKNIWRFSEKIQNDVGVLVMNGGEAYGNKIILLYKDDQVTEMVSGKEWKGYETLDENYEFYHDLGGANIELAGGGYIYLYCDKGNPGEIFDQIEFNTRGNVIGAKSNCTFDNLCIMYGGSHGIGAGTVKNLTVTNCEVGWIGGSLQFYKEGRPTRFGNGIEIYGGCTNFLIENCYVYQCYDAGVTHQYSAGGENDIIMDGVYYRNNLIERCIYSIEYFLGKPDGGNPTRYMKDVYMTDNLLIDSGYGFGEQRPDKTPAAHIKAWDHMNTLQGEFIVENNVFLRSTRMMIHVGVSNEEHLPIVRNNVFAQLKGGQWGRFSKNPTELEMYTYDAVSSPAFAENEFYVIMDEE